MPSSAETANDTALLREAGLARVDGANKFPERKAVEEYAEAQRTSMLQLIRGGAVMVSLLHIAYFVADAYRIPELRPTLLLDGACITMGLAGFAVTHSQWFIRHWRATALLVCTLEVLATAWLSIIEPDTTRLLITVLLYSCGSASLVPWSPLWQQSLNATCVLALIAQAIWLPLAEAHRVDRWIAMAIAAGVGQFATTFGERFRHQLLHRAQMLDEADSMLREQSRRSERIVQHLLRAEEQLRASEQRFELFMQRLPGPAFIRDAEGRYVFVNERALRTTRTTAADWLGKSDGEIIDLAPDELARIRDTDREILASGKPVRVIETLTRPIVTHWLVHKFPIPGADGKFAMVGGVSLDIGDRVRAEQALKQSEEMFRSLVENANDIITLTDLSGKMIFHSPSLERVTGFRPEEVLGKSAFDFIHPDDLAQVAEGIANAANNPGVPSPGRFRIHHKDGSWRVLETVGVLLSGDPPRLLVNARDITEREQFEADLARARDAALEASRLKSSFLANMSHEIRTPLHIILGYSEFIAQRLIEEGIDGFRSQFDAMGRAGVRLLATIQQILDFSKIEVGAFDVAPVSLEVVPVIERLIAELKVLAEAKHLELACEIAAPGAVATFDEYCLSGALTNLLQNAIKFTESGRVSIRLYHDAAGQLCIDVSDTGIGMEPEYLPRLFEAFSQERTGYTRKFEGSGLGLALARKYLELNGARLSVESAPGRGTTFTIHFSSAPAGSDATRAA